MARWVLLHGFCGQPEQWRYLQDELERRGHSTVALRLPRGTWEAEIAAVREVAEDSYVVGHSLGGLLTRAFAETHPNVARGLATIAAPPAAYMPDWLSQVGARDADGWFRCDTAAFLDIAFPGAPQELYELTWVQPPLRGAPDLPGGHGDEPRLALLCTEDKAVPYAEQVAAAKAFDASSVELTAGHSPHVTDPATVASALITALTAGPA